MTSQSLQAAESNEERRVEPSNPEMILRGLRSVQPMFRLTLILELFPFWVISILAYGIRRLVGHTLPMRLYDRRTIFDAPISCKDSCGHTFEFRQDPLYFLMALNQYEEDFRIMDHLVTRDDVCLDVGAHVGLWTVHMAQKAKLVIAVEPEPQNLQLLFRNSKVLNRGTNVNIVPAAVSSRDGSTTLYTSRHSGLHSLTHQPAGFQSSIEVPTITMSTLFDRFRVNKVAFLKVDVEGAESLVLSSLFENDKFYEIRAALIEVSADDKSTLASLKERWKNVRLLRDYGTAKDYLVF